ncbi:MAG: serine/threonine-protein kinase [Polyangia bacterium]
MSLDRIGPYQVVRKLGEGGMGAVYEAVQDPIGRRVAIKILHPKYAQDPSICARFFNEARAVNLIDHAGVVQISDYGQLPDGTAYLVMEYLKGETLSQRQKSKGMPPLPEVMRLARQIASALSAAHEKSVYHRDLKPDNIMLVPDHDSEVPGRERVKLLDFGIAKVAQADDAAPGQAQPKTSTDVVMGTPRYMAPEQCKGGVQIDDKADVYSLGVMLYEMLAGRPPFVGGSGEVLAMHIYEPPQPLKTLAPHVPEEIAQLVHLLLSKKREERPNMKQVMARLEELGQRHPTSMLPAISMAALLPPSLTPPGTNPHQTPTAGTSASSTLGLSAGQAQNGRSPKMLLLGLLGGGTALLGVLAILLLRPQPKPVVTVQPVKTIPVDMASPAPPQPVAAKPKQIHWSVQTTPPGAQIVRVSDGQILGGTPMELDQSASDGSCEVKLKLPGFADKVIKLSLADNETRKETLDKAPVVRPILKPRPGIGKTTSTPSKGNDEQPRIVD